MRNKRAKMAKTGSETHLTPSQQRAIAALLEARDVRSAAATAGVGERTLYRWMGEEAFQSVLQQQQNELLQNVLRRLTNASSMALDALERGMQATEPMPQQLRAADIVLSKLLKAREMLETEERLEALERAIQVEYVNNWRTMGDGSQEA